MKSVLVEYQCFMVATQDLLQDLLQSERPGQLNSSRFLTIKYFPAERNTVYSGYSGHVYSGHSDNYSGHFSWNKIYLFYYI